MLLLAAPQNHTSTSSDDDTDVVGVGVGVPSLPQQEDRSVNNDSKPAAVTSTTIVCTTATTTTTTLTDNNTSTAIHPTISSDTTTTTKNNNIHMNDDIKYCRTSPMTSIQPTTRSSTTTRSKHIRPKKEEKKEGKTNDITSTSSATKIIPNTNNKKNNTTRTTSWEKDHGKVEKVLVIGAGMSGLAVARELQERGYQIVLVEARERVGGRLKGSPLYLQQQQQHPLSSMSSDNTSKIPTLQCTSRQNSNPNETNKKQKKNYNTNNAADPINKIIQNGKTKDNSCQIDLGGALIHGIDDNPVYQVVQDIGIPTVSVQDCLLLSESGWPVDPKQDERVALAFNDCLEETFQRIHSTRNVNETKSVVGTTSFGEVFQKVCKDRIITQDALFRWHKANLEVSCGASFDEIGWQWNEDEPYGFDGDHVAVSTSWAPIVQALAEPLLIQYSAVVRRIQIVHPSATTAVTTDHTPTTTTFAEELKSDKNETLTRKKSKHYVYKTKKMKAEALPVRLSRRLRGESADTVSARRSLRMNKGTGIDMFTIQHDPQQQLHQKRSQSSSSRRRNTNDDNDNGDHNNSAGLPSNKSVVQVTLESGEVLQADAVVCTVPLGILKQKHIVFDPPLPTAKQEAIDSLGTGLLNKCALSFDVQFWQDSDFLGLAESERSYLVLNMAKVTGKPVVLFMYGGAFARQIEEWTDAEIVEDCLVVLQRICGQVHTPVDYQITRWGKEQYSRMSFTYIPPGVDGISQLAAMSQPIYDYTGRIPIVMFAGEHTTPYHPSTIHGAFLSGIREAYRLDCLMEPEANDFLEFSEDSIYQKTFHIKRKYRSHSSGNTITQNSSAKTSTIAAMESPRNRSLRQHRRRGAAGIMKLRSRPKSIFPTNALTSPNIKKSSHTHTNSSNGKYQHKHQSTVSNVTPSSRRSQRAAALSATASILHLDAVNTSSSNHVVTEREATNVDLEALEDRTLLRSLESYGPNYKYLMASILPVHGGETTDIKTVAQVEKRCRQLQPKGKRKRSNLSASTIWQAWVAKTVVSSTIP